ncbi:hypothetical protein BU17DRAFT_88759 [Hysterangium stoloniferum]|nr:hypothetical protein BU17DRAFT_88759 [Hysterangium stoloniferum]
MTADGPQVPGGWHPLPLPTPRPINTVNHPGGNNIPNATLIGQTRCKELKAAFLRTNDDTITHPTPFIDELPINSRIARLRRHPDLCPNLFVYGDLNGQGVLWQPIHNEPPLMPRCTSATVNNSQATAATAREQAMALDCLANWYINHITRMPNVMTCSKSLEDEILIQLIEPLNHHLASRYANKNTIVDVPANNTDTPRYPLWIRSPPRRAAHHGGYPDFLLVTHPTAPAGQSHKAIIHVKTWWSYPNATFRSIFHAHTAYATTGAFNWVGNAVQHQLIKQLWGSLVSQRCQWGMCTNGKLLFVFRRVGNANPDLYVSQMMTFEDHRVQSLMAGLSFAAIDENNNTINRLSRYLWPAHRVNNNW